MANREALITLITAAARPHLEVGVGEGRWRLVPFKRTTPRNERGMRQWVARPSVPRTGRWRFRIRLRQGYYLPPAPEPCFETSLDTLWVQGNALFAYKPNPRISPSKVIKIDDFEGSLAPRPLYVYLPRGYAEHLDRHYPILYMQDGQNCFEAYAADSYAGSWHADETADALIKNGEMRECIIVGVGHGGPQRTIEYLPPYARMPKPAARHPSGITKRNMMSLPGLAAQTFRYYRDDVAPYIQNEFRTLTGREDVGICGSSMGGLFALYTGWEHPEFARQVAALSTSFWTTRTGPNHYETIERLRRGEHRDIRLWLDSGTLSSPGKGDDGFALTRRARDVLLDKGYVIGDNFQYHREDGATHSEAAWAARLNQVFRFLFPLR